jgi:chorismate mutase
MNLNNLTGEALRENKINDKPLIKSVFREVVKKSIVPQYQMKYQASQ